MSRSSARGQVEPLAALVAVFAACFGLVVYAGALDGVLSTAPMTDPAAVGARAALDGVHERAATGGVVDPAAFGQAVAASRYPLNATLGVDGLTVTAGPPVDGTTAARPVSVARGGGRVARGWLRVVVA